MVSHQSVYIYFLPFSALNKRSLRQAKRDLFEINRHDLIEVLFPQVFYSTEHKQLTETKENYQIMLAHLRYASL